MRYLKWTFIALFLLIVPNLIWLSTSTVRIHNASGSSVDAIAYRACETNHWVGTLRPHQSVFRFLEACGEDTLEIVVDRSRFCQMYVEGELYHVDAIIADRDTVVCEYQNLLSSLFILKVLM